MSTPVAPGPDRSDAGFSFPPAKVRFSQDSLVQPAATYVGVDDRLYVRCVNSVAGVVLGIRVRLIVADNGQVIPYAFRHTPNTNRTLSVENFQITEGYLLGLAVNVDAGSVRRGQTWVEVGILHGTGGADFVEVLFADQVSTSASDGYPFGMVRDSLEGPGAIRSVLGVDPGAGVEASDTVPTGARWKLRGWRVQLVTDATAPVRRVHLVIDDGANILHDFVAADTQAATLTRNYNAAPDGFQRAAQDSEIYIPIPLDLMLFQGFRIRTVTTALAAGDNYGPTRLYVEEWPEL